LTSISLWNDPSNRSTRINDAIFRQLRPQAENRAAHGLDEDSHPTFLNPSLVKQQPGRCHTRGNDSISVRRNLSHASQSERRESHGSEGARRIATPKAEVKGSTMESAECANCHTK
jgi:hypothetical protein